jgi:hypothetical protein
MTQGNSAAEKSAILSETTTVASYSAFVNPGALHRPPQGLQ